MGFRRWLEMLTPPPPALTANQRVDLGLLNALPTGTAKLSKWRRRDLKARPRDK